MQIEVNRHPYSNGYLFVVVQLLDGFETTQDSIENALPKLIKDSGFIKVDNENYLDFP